jgi:soluble lytic murein transglycosylase-like protein
MRTMRSPRFRPATLCVFIWAFSLFATFLLSVQSRSTPYDGIIASLSREYNIPAKLVHSIIQAESDYEVQAVSHKGAQGLMQLMPATARQYGVDDVFDPAQNIRGGIRYLKDLMKLYNNSTNLVLAAYNAGQSAVEKYGGIPPYRETINYIEKIRKSSGIKSIISSGTEIYMFVDENGRKVVTNDYLLYKQHLAKKKK